MNGIQTAIIKSLKFFGAMRAITIQAKLKELGEIHSIDAIKLALNDLLYAKKIHTESGFKGAILYVVNK